MKIILSLTLALLLNVVYAQNDSIIDCAIEANKKGMVYLKNFQTKLDPANNTKMGEKWPIVLNKGSKYRFYLCEKNQDKPEQVVLTLFDDTHPENAPYATTTKRGHFYFECNKTDTYHISIRYKEEYGKNEVSAVGVLLFVGKKSN
ncbi:MAG: hypothetical protein ABFS35_11790 [Bacteroidota bacterium]